MAGNIAVYMAGDAGIFFPGVVALHSIQKHNTSMAFDYFMCFDQHDLTSKMRSILSANNINFVDTAELAQHGSIDGLTVMREGRWPSHVFNNWILPDWLHARGYERALKVDYDLLCLGGYNLSDLMPDDQTTVSGLTFGIDLLNEGVTASALKELDIPVKDGKARVPYYNAGVVGVNLNRYTDKRAFEAFSSVYRTIHKGGASVTNAEQAALAIVAYHDDCEIKSIPTEYNQRITLLPKLDSAGMPIIKNIHYVTHNKPWKEPNYERLHHYVRNGRTSVYIYRGLWHEYAQGVEGYAQYIEARHLDPLAHLAMFTTILNAYRK